MAPCRWQATYDGVEALDGKIYFSSGGFSGGGINVFERLDPAKNQWETLTQMSTTRFGATATVLNGKLYVIGGLDFSSMEIYDPQTGKWSTGVDLPTVVGNGACAITHQGKIYVIGGASMGSPTPISI